MDPFASTCADCDPTLHARLQEVLNSRGMDDAFDLLNNHHEHFVICPQKLLSSVDKDSIAHLIYTAIDRDCSNVMEIVINYGCDLNHGIQEPFRKYARSPLYHAAKNGHRKFVKLLLDAGCDKNALNNTGSTALYEAVYLNQVDSVRLLLDYGCDPNIPDMYGKTPLHVIPFMCSGSIQDQQHCVQLLLQGGADISIKCNNGQTPADVAIQFKFCPLLQTIMDNAQLLTIKTIPHCPEALSDRILPEYLLSPLNTDGVTSVARMLVQLHTCHTLNIHTMEEFIRICEMNQPEEFYTEAKKFHRLMITSGIPKVPVKSPLMLQESCRVLLRRRFGLECWYRLEQLPLPRGLKDYLQLRGEILDYAPL